MIERISLQRAVAVISDDAIAIRRSRAQLLVPFIQLGIAAGAVLLIVFFLDSLPLPLLAVLLAIAILLGPISTLGLLYNLLGNAVVLERDKQSVRWQQGLFGLGLGTSELVPFWRIDHIAVSGDYDEVLAGGDRQDLVTWDVELVKDNGKRLSIGMVVVARPFAEEGLARANQLAQSVAERSDTIAQLAELAIERVTTEDSESTSSGYRRRRLVRVSDPRTPEVER